MLLCPTEPPQFGGPWAGGPPAGFALGGSGTDQVDYEWVFVLQGQPLKQTGKEVLALWIQIQPCSCLLAQQALGSWESDVDWLLHLEPRTM